MIELKQITVLFAPQTPLRTVIFNRFDLKIQEGDFITLIGGNGAGKSTLLNLMAGDIFPQSGALYFEGVDITRWTPQKRALFISRVFQDPLLGTYADLTIEENLSIAWSKGNSRTLRSALSASLMRYFQERLAEVGLGLENRLKDKMGLLSGGQRQAISLVMATLQPSKILLLDEHTAALDPRMEQIILSFTQKLIAEKKLTTIMITHSMAQALEYGNRTLILRHGKPAQDLSEGERLGLNTTDLMAYF